MPAKFHQVTPTVWDRTMRELSGPAKVVRLYVMTCPARVTEGLFQLPLGHLIHDTGMKEDHVREGLAKLDAAGLVSYDHDAEVVLDRTALRFTPLRNGTNAEGEVRPDKRIAGAVRLFEQVPPSPLKVELYRVAQEYSPDLARALERRFPGLAASTWDDTPFHAPPEPLVSPLQAPSRDRARARDREEQSSGEVPQCEWGCGKGAQVTAGVVQVGPGDRPWCGWCDTEAAS